MKHAFARRLRRAQTDAERRLWHALRGRRFQGFKFRRQQPIGPYIVDFACLESRLAIELDGDRHGSEWGLQYDAARSRRLAQDGFQVLRFPNRDVLRHLEDVLEEIARVLRVTSPSPAVRADARPAALSHKGRGQGIQGREGNCAVKGGCACS